MIIKLSLKFDVSFCKLMFGVVGLSAAVGAVHYFVKKKHKVSDGIRHDGNVSKNGKSCNSGQISSADSKLTSNNKEETNGKQKPLTARCKSVSQQNSVVSRGSNSGDDKYIVNPAARNKTYFPDRETSYVSKSASGNIKSSFSNKPVLVEPSSVAQPASAISSNTTINDNDGLDSKVECNKTLFTETPPSESSASVADMSEKNSSVKEQMSKVSVGSSIEYGMNSNNEDNKHSEVKSPQTKVPSEESLIIEKSDAINDSEKN